MEKVSWRQHLKNHKIAARAFCSPYLFQDGFPHRRLVGKAAQEELSQLDCEVGKEGKISYNIWGKTLQKKKKSSYNANTIKPSNTRLYLKVEKL